MLLLFMALAPATPTFAILLEEQETQEFKIAGEMGFVGSAGPGFQFALPAKLSLGDHHPSSFFNSSSRARALKINVTIR
jgi:hypothetical protein